MNIMLLKDGELFRRPENDPDALEFHQRLVRLLSRTQSVIAGTRHRRQADVGDLHIRETITTSYRDMTVVPLNEHDVYDKNAQYLLEAVVGVFPLEDRIFAYEIDNRRRNQHAPTVWIDLACVREWLPAVREHMILDDLADV